MIIYLYGRYENDIEETRDWLEKTLDIALSERESFYYGGMYFINKNQKYNARLQNNIDLVENNFEEKDFSRFKTLLYISLNDNKISTDDFFVKILHRLTYLRQSVR